MRIIKVEGSIGMPGRPYQDDNEAEAERAGFEQLINQTLPPGENNLVSLKKRVVFTQRYRVMGGYLDGVECEVTECAGEIYLKVTVPQHEIYRSIKRLKQWIESQLLHVGYATTLEIFYANNGK
ncbi:type III secretion system protein SsaP [Salmonella enterica subsp. salamae]|nr:type III secretion system protein SsaP [Salmonella enterica subsp. salamae]ECJ2280066.1 type III secretion system protein SsaP [Salmonella enterica subsp. salamae]HCC0886927.1 type III secretion system protein SsaP [Salmonella enterica]